MKHLISNVNRNRHLLPAKAIFVQLHKHLFCVASTKAEKQSDETAAFWGSVRARGLVHRREQAPRDKIIAAELLAIGLGGSSRLKCCSDCIAGAMLHAEVPHFVMPVMHSND